MQVDLEKAALLFQSLTDITRLRILRLFLTVPDELCLCDVSEALNEPTYKVSRHLKALREAGLLHSQREGRWLYHRVVDDKSTDKSLFRFLAAVQDSKGLFELDCCRLKSRRKKTAERCSGKQERGRA